MFIILKKSANILPVVYPPIDAFPHHGAVFSMLFAREECKPWIYNNYIQTFSIKDMYGQKVRSGTVDFFFNQYGDWKYYELKANPWIRTKVVPMDLFDTYKIDIIQFLKKYIDQSNYCFFPIDRYYIPAYKHCYRKRHIDHDIFIYGYDDRKKLFYMSDNTAYKYEQTTVKYEELSNSFYSIIKLFHRHEKKFFYSEKSIMLLKVMKNTEVNGKNPTYIKETYDINSSKILNDTKEYLLKDNYGEKYRRSEYYVYGIDCYDELEKFVCQYNIKNIDFRGFYSFLQHKKLMLLRMEYLNVNYNLSEQISEYRKLVNIFNIVISLILRYNTKSENRVKDHNILETIKNYLRQCKESEITILNSFIQIVGNHK